MVVGGKAADCLIHRVGAGGLALFAAYRWGAASVVTPLTALYPLITVILAVVFLHEHLDLVKVVGIAVAMIAGVALGKE